MHPVPDFASHRAKLLQRLGSDEAVLLFGGPHHLRNGDAEFKYRPHSDVYWLTGWPDPQVAIFLRPGKEPLTVFCQPKDKEREIWNGFRPGPEGAKADFGADVALEFGQLEAELPALLQGVRVLHHAFAVEPEYDALLMSAISKAARAARRNGLDVPSTFHDPSHLLHELRLVKNDDEVNVMRRAAEITCLAHTAAMALTAPGVNEGRLEALINFTFRDQGGSGAGYNTIVAGGSNAIVLHYVTNNMPLVDGELVLVDAGCEYELYTADVTRTWPVNGTFSDPQRQVYEAVLRAQVAAIDACRVGNSIMDVHDTAIRHLTEGLVELGLLTGEVDDLIEAGDFRKYYMHGTSHWLGLDVHDVGSYAADGASRKLAPGMVLTIEPGLYVGTDDEDAPRAMRGIGIRIEDDVLITDGDPEVLTDAIPKTIEEVEAACARRGDA